MSECIQTICSRLMQRYRELERKLSELKEQFGCEPLCEDRYQSIRRLSVVLDVLYELIRALGCE